MLGLIAPETPAADEAVTALLAVLRSDFLPTRIAAIEALGHFGTEAAIAIPGIRALRDDQNPLVKQAAGRALDLLVDENDPLPQD